MSIHEKATYEREMRSSTHYNSKNSSTIDKRTARTNTVCNSTLCCNIPYLIKYFMLSVFLISAICIGSIFIVKASERSTKSLNKYYTSVIVQEDDTLWDIADQYSGGTENRSAYINAVKKLNNMATDTLYKGQNLVVYYYSEEVK